jgi:RNA polymerase sigma-70 factor, ECF subfamily
MQSGSADRSPSDEELAVEAQRGCRDSFEELLRRFQQPLLHFLRLRATESDAEDLLQETFVRAYVKLDQYRPRWPFATWLFTIARRVNITHHRRRRVGVEDVAIEAAASEPSPLEAVVAAESRQRLWELAAQVLSEQQVTALWLHYVEEVPIKEIAAVLGRTLVSVKIIMFRARKKLMPALADLDGVQAEPRSASATRERLTCCAAAEVSDG